MLSHEMKTEINKSDYYISKSIKFSKDDMKTNKFINF